MTQIIKLSRLAVWSTFALYVFQSFFALWSVLFVTSFELDRPPEPFDRLTLFVAFIFFSYGVFGIHHLLKFTFGRRRHTELRFDGETISVQIAGRELTRFTASGVHVYYPHQNDIELTDGSRITLPSSVPHTAENVIEMALPWVNAWWPALDLRAAIEAAERKTGWVRHLPNVSKALGAFGILLCMIMLKRFDLALSTAMLAVAITMSFVIPDLLGVLWRRKIVIHFPAINDGELEPEPSVDHDESIAHDRT